MRKLIDLTGRRFGKLKVIKRTLNDGNQPTWLCKCDCGKEIIVRGDQLRYKKIKSCGCERNKKINFKYLNLYNSYLLWCLINHQSDINEWEKSYEIFYNWIKK